MAPSKEVNEAVGEAPTAAEQLEDKKAELAQAQTALDAAEVAMDVPKVVELQAVVETLRRFIRQLEARATLERAAEAREDAVALDAVLRKRYAAKLDALTPDIDETGAAIRAMAKAVRKCLTTWSAAARARFEAELLALRFGFDTPDLDVLPASPADAATAAFWEALDGLDRLTRRDTLPVFATPASDTAEQRSARGMAAAAEFVNAYAQDMKLTPELRQLFEKAGPIGVPVSPRRDEPLFSGDDSLIPPGAYQTALGPAPGPTMPETAEEKEEREEQQRLLSRKRADRSRQMGEAADLLKKGLPL